MINETGFFGEQSTKIYIFVFIVKFNQFTESLLIESIYKKETNQLIRPVN